MDETKKEYFKAFAFAVFVPEIGESSIIRHRY
jgi:hypothetical protein